MNRRRYALHLAVFGVSAMLFGGIAFSVVANEPAGTLDRVALAWAHAHAASLLTTMMLRLSFLGAPSATSVYASVLAIIFLCARRVRAAFIVAGIIYGGMLLNVVVKHAFGRERPTVEHPVVALATYSFPSGHAAASTIFSGLLCVLALRSAAREAYKVFAIFAAILWVGAVCTSRVYLGAHYLTDVLGGIAEGIAWLALSTLLLDVRGISAARGTSLR